MSPLEEEITGRLSNRLCANAEGMAMKSSMPCTTASVTLTKATAMK